MLLDDLDRILCIPPYLRFVRSTTPELAYLLGERERYALRGVEIAVVLERLDGIRSVHQLLDACSDALRPEQALYVLELLDGLGLLMEVQAGPPERVGFDAARLPRSGATALVALIDATAGHDSAHSEGATRAVEAMGEALDGAGLQLVGSERAHVRVIVATDYLDPSCTRELAAARSAGQPHFLVKPAGLRAFIGPYFDGSPGQACWRCLCDALRQQRPVERVLVRDDPGRAWPTLPPCANPTSLRVGAGLAALELCELLAVAPEKSRGSRLRVFDFTRSELTEHRVRYRPQCPECGDPNLQARQGERPIELGSAAIAYAADGGLRREHPTESIARLGHLVSPVLGPVTHLHPMPGRHSEARPVFSSGYVVAPRDPVARDDFDRPCAGKGCTVEQARMSALAEALERYCGVHQGDEASRVACLRELGIEAVDPADLQLFSRAQQARRDDPRVAPPLALDTPIAWAPAWSLSTGRRRYVPLAYCYAEAPESTGARYCRSSSNGCAAGNDLAEAILQALFEAIERDAVAIWWYARAQRPPAIVPASAIAYYETTRAAYEARGWSLWALDATHDLGLPVVVAVAVERHSDRFALGFGCHEGHDLALRRALTELDQVFDPEGKVASPWDGLAASRLGHLQPNPNAPRSSAAPPIASPMLDEHVWTWVARLRERELETIVVDKTRVDIDLRVVQVIVPGLRHPWPRLAPGRLYTVPVAEGWIAQPLAEHELNPAPLLI